MPRRHSNRFSAASAATPIAPHATSRFTAVPKSLTRNKRETHLVYLFDEMLVINCAFGRYLDGQGVTAFSVVVDDVGQELALRFFKNNEERQLVDTVHEAEGIVSFRPNGPTRNAGRRLNIAYVQKDRGWLQKNMAGQTETERRRFPIFDAQERVYVLKANT